MNIIKPFLKSSVEVRSVLILIHDDPEGEGSDRADHFSSASSLPAGHSPTTEPRQISWLPHTHTPHIYLDNDYDGGQDYLVSAMTGMLPGPIRQGPTP